MSLSKKEYQDVGELIIPYDISNWRKVGIERGYWDYFKEEVIKEYLKTNNKKDVTKKL
jgi:hypothetical protein